MKDFGKKSILWLTACSNAASLHTDANDTIKTSWIIKLESPATDTPLWADLTPMPGCHYTTVIIATVLMLLRIVLKDSSQCVCCWVCMFMFYIIVYSVTIYTIRQHSFANKWWNMAYQIKMHAYAIIAPFLFILQWIEISLDHLLCTLNLKKRLCHLFVLSQRVFLFQTFLGKNKIMMTALQHLINN